MPVTPLLDKVASPADTRSLSLAELRQLADELRAETIDARSTTFARIAVPEVQFRDQYSALAGVDDLVAHSGATRRFMPNIRLERSGDVRHCQGSVLADWKAVMNGASVSEGTNVFVLAPNGMIEWVTGFWKPQAAPSSR